MFIVWNFEYVINITGVLKRLSWVLHVNTNFNEIALQFQKKVTPTSSKRNRINVYTNQKKSILTCNYGYWFTPLWCDIFKRKMCHLFAFNIGLWIKKGGKKSEKRVRRQNPQYRSLQRVYVNRSWMETTEKANLLFFISLRTNTYSVFFSAVPLSPIIVDNMSPFSGSFRGVANRSWLRWHRPSPTLFKMMT